MRSKGTILTYVNLNTSFDVLKLPGENLAQETHCLRKVLYSNTAVSLTHTLLVVQEGIRYSTMKINKALPLKKDVTSLSFISSG
jgi:hypothetical protein